MKDSRLHLDARDTAVDSDQWTVISGEKVYSYAFQTEICTSFSCNLLQVREPLGGYRFKPIRSDSLLAD